MKSKLETIKGLLREEIKKTLKEGKGEPTILTGKYVIKGRHGDDGYWEVQLYLDNTPISETFEVDLEDGEVISVNDGRLRNDFQKPMVEFLMQNSDKIERELKKGIKGGLREGSDADRKKSWIKILNALKSLELALKGMQADGSTEFVPDEFDVLAKLLKKAAVESEKDNYRDEFGSYRESTLKEEETQTPEQKAAEAKLLKAKQDKAKVDITAIQKQLTLKEGDPGEKVKVYYYEYYPHGSGTTVAKLIMTWTQLSDIITMQKTKSGEEDEYVEKIVKDSKSSPAYFFGEIMADNPNLLKDLAAKKTIGIACEEGSAGFSVVSKQAAKEACMKKEYETTSDKNDYGW